MAFTPQAKAEKALKELQKLPANKRCADCSGNGSLAPQYVCVNFGTFICQNCSTAHRALNHRVKGVSMSVFSPEEVAKLQAAGNEAARARYMPAFTGKLPDAEDAAAIKAFVRAVYVENKFAAAAAPATSAVPALPPRPSTAPHATSAARAAAFDAFAGTDDVAPPPVPPRKSQAVAGSGLGASPPVPAPSRAAGDPFGAGGWGGDAYAAQAGPSAGGADPFAASFSPVAAPVAALTSAMGAWGGVGGGGDPFAPSASTLPPIAPRPASSASASVNSGGGGSVSDASRAASPAAWDSFPTSAAPGLPSRTLSPAHGPGTPDTASPAPQPVPVAAQRVVARELPSDLFSSMGDVSPPVQQPPVGSYGAPHAAYAHAPPQQYAPPPQQYAPPPVGAAPHRRISTNPFDDVAVQEAPPAPYYPQQPVSYYGSPPAAGPGGFGAAGMSGWGAAPQAPPPQPPPPARMSPPAAPAAWGSDPFAAQPPAFAAPQQQQQQQAPPQPDPFASLMGGGF